MWKIAFCLLVLVVCMELSTADHHHDKISWSRAKRKGIKNIRKIIKPKIKSLRKTFSGKFGGDYADKKAEDYTKASNPEMMMMMRMKKMLSPFRKFMTKVLDLGHDHHESVDGRPAFCGENECPDFKVIKKSTHYELRHYQPSKWVSTSAVGQSWTSEIQKSLFWPLFGYIQGANKKGEKIDMTVPVITSIRPTKPNEWNFTMSFFLSPSIATPPAPTNDKVFLTSKSDFKVYVHSFKGFAWGQKVWEKHAEMMKKHLDKDKQKYVSSDKLFITAGYDDPMKLFNRHNEVWLKAETD
ncbi:heme-binding protein 2 [Exaiptasia diaphana]|uniref:Heme-binding protein 1 n=1 Tax=Exaiptasia diaphana TaxID=2652724 RepID=A0A913X6T9_EXADI|nr:heme-binding protein 2 [Exaiptasia diaphana]KXJ28510.1 Heme-binding protein 2 [Exaiptasia diaphana]